MKRVALVVSYVVSWAAFAVPPGLPADRAESGFVLPSVRLFDADTGRVLEGRTIVVADGCVAAVEKDERAARSKWPELPVLEEHRGRFVTPGLVDAHVHAASAEFDGLFLAHGVTTVRDLGAFEDAAFSRLEASRRDPEQPRFLVVGPIVDGSPPVWPFSATPGSPEEARKLVERLARRGACAVKVYSRLEPGIHRAVVAAAHEYGLPAVGHVPAGLDAFGAVEAGQDEIEHLDGVVDRLLPEDRLPLDAGARWRMGTELWAKADPVRFAEVAARFAREGTVHCPTLVVLDRSDRLGDPALDREPLIDAVGEPWRSMWSASQDAGRESFERRRARIETARAHRLQFVAALHEAGVALLVGSDTPNPFVVPGASLLWEIESFVAAGIPPAEALRLATAGNADRLGIGDTAGRIAPGRDADLVILEGDPTRDLSALRRIAAVSRLGRLQTPDEWLSGPEPVSRAVREEDAEDWPPLEEAAADRRLFRVRYEGTFAGRPARGEEAIALEGRHGRVRILADTLSTFPVETRTRYDLEYDAQGNPLRCSILQKRGAVLRRATYAVDGSTLLGVLEGPQGRESVALELPGPEELGAQSLAAGYVHGLWGEDAPAHAVRFDETTLRPILEERPPVEIAEEERELPIGRVRGAMLRFTVEEQGMRFDVEFLHDPAGVPVLMVVRLPFGDFRLEVVELER